MKKVLLSFLTFFLLLNFLCAQDWISIIGKTPYPQGTKVYFTGYEGFNKLDLGSIRTSANGEIDFFTDYHGFCTMSAEGMKSYSLILEHDTVCIDWGNEQKFSCDPENVYFYRKMPEMLRLDSMYDAYLTENDSLQKVHLFTKMKETFGNSETMLSRESSVHANVFLQAELSIRRIRIVEDGEQMASSKDDMLNFISDNYGILNHSNYLTKLAAAYLDMNKFVLKSETSLRQAIEYDVDVWVTRLGTEMTEKEIVNFFLIHFVKNDESEAASDVVVKYGEFVKCEQWVGATLRPTTMPFTFSVFGGPDFSKVYNLDQFFGISKILAMYSTECPASVAAVAGLYAYMSEKQIRMPVILVPDAEPEGELAELIVEKAPFGLQTGVKTGGSLMLGAGIKQLPAFMILDRNNMQEEIIYNLDDLKRRIGGEE